VQIFCDAIRNAIERFWRKFAAALMVDNELILKRFLGIPTSTSLSLSDAPGQLKTDRSNSDQIDTVDTSQLATDRVRAAFQDPCDLLLTGLSIP
jgi:hypothetical protein